MHATLFELLGYPVTTHGVVSALAILIGLYVTTYFARQAGRKEEDVVSLAMVTVLGGLVGARLWEVLFFSPGYYLQHPLEVFAVWNGGMSVQGGLIGGIATGVWYVRRLKWEFWATADLFAPGMILGQAIGRAACFLNGDAYGAPTGSSFGVVFPPGTAAYERYGDQPLWPAEVWEGQWNIVVFALLLLLMKQERPKGVIFIAYVTLYSAGRFVLEWFRGDNPPGLLDLTTGQWTSVGAVAVTVVLYLMTKRRVVQ